MVSILNLGDVSLILPNNDAFLVTKRLFGEEVYVTSWASGLVYHFVKIW